VFAFALELGEPLLTAGRLQYIVCFLQDVASSSCDIERTAAKERCRVLEPLDENDRAHSS